MLLVALTGSLYLFKDDVKETCFSHENTRDASYQTADFNHALSILGYNKPK